MKNFIDKVDVVAGGEQDAVHHVVHAAVLLLDAAQAGVAGSPVRQRAAVGVAFLLLRRPVGLWFQGPLLLFILAGTTHGHSLPTRRRNEPGHVTDTQGTDKRVGTCRDLHTQI